MMAIRFSFMALLLASAAFAQTPGIGETRPAPPQEQNAPAKDEALPPAPSQRTPRAAGEGLSRCEKVADTQREQCLREERNAAGGGTRRTEPATAPPPQNPRQ